MPGSWMWPKNLLEWTGDSSTLSFDRIGQFRIMNNGRWLQRNTRAQPVSSNHEVSPLFKQKYCFILPHSIVYIITYII